MFEHFFQHKLLSLAWLQTIVAMLGSLYFSEIAHFAPCTLCWYQRICMYPLVVILTVGILEDNRHIDRYVLPLSVTGMVIALYHNLLTWGLIGEPALICTPDVPCTENYINWFGFVTIPLLSFVAFTLINVIMLIQIFDRKQKFRNTKNIKI